jgi:hypothetical protein
MSQRNGILFGILVLQLIVIVALFWPRGSTVAASKLYPQLESDAVTSLTISDETRTLVLAKKDGKWVLPNADDFPVNEVRVSDLLTKVAQIDAQRLVASNPASHHRLQVSDDSFQRKVEISQADGNQVVLLVGSAPNARATHVRDVDSDNVYLTSALSTADVRSDVGNWIDTAYLQTNANELTAISLSNHNGRFEFTKDAAGAWVMTGLADGETVNQTALDALLNRMATFNMLEPLAKEPAPDWSMGTPTATITLTLQTTTTVPAQEIVLEIGAKFADGSGYPVKASTSEYYVKVAQFAVEPLLNNQRSDFVTALVASPVTAPITATQALTGSIPATVTLPLTSAQP